MNDTATVEPPIEEAPVELSIKDHAAQFGAGSPREADAEIEVDAVAEPDPLKPIRPVDQQRREQGKFTEGKQRIKAKDAVERINQLTGRAKSAEERLAAAEAELVTLRTQRAPAAQIERAEAKVERAEAKTDAPAPRGPGFTETEPDENDPKFGGDYGKYLRAAAAYDIRKENFEQAHAQRQQAAEHRERASFNERVTRGQAKYADYDAVALGPWRPGEPRIADGSVTDRFIMEDDNGEEVLYHLRKFPQELDAILRLPTALSQAKALSLLSQRFASSPRLPAGTTTSAAPPIKVVLPPKPPNVVRTEAQRASDSPPTGEASSIDGHRKLYAPKSR